jgi:hypothetical protein
MSSYLLTSMHAGGANRNAGEGVCENIVQRLVRKGVPRSQEHPPGSATAKSGNLWG